MNISIKRYSKEAISLAIFLAAYVPTLIWMWDRWFARDSYYSHGFMIPLVSGFLIWQMRDELRETPKYESPWGIRLIVLGIALHLLSSLFRIYFSSGFSMLIVLVGMILHFFGGQVLRKISFPIGFLIFMFPLPLVIIKNLSFSLKLFAAQMATIMLNQMGLLAVQEGSIIKMKSTYVIVDDVCSGLRSLISLTALGSIVAFWLKGPMWKRILLFLTTIPIAIVTNMFRVIFLSVVSEVWGTEYVEGFVHDFTGFMVFALAFLLFFGFKKLIE